MAQIYLVVFWALLLMIIAGDDDIGSLKECENVPFVPGHNLAGEGFDVVTMERRGSYVINTETWDLGNGTCKLLPAAVVDWRALPKCSMKVSSQIFESSEALVNDSSSALSVSWKVGRCQGRWSCSWKHSFLGSKFCNEKIKSRQIHAEHPAREGLKKAVEEYITEYALMKVCSEPGKIGRKCSARDRCACVCESSQIIKSNCRPAEKGLATLKVYSLRAKGLYGDRSTQIDCTVTVTYDNQIKRTETIDDNDNPRWPETFKFVYDVDSSWNSDFLGTCSFHLRSGVVTDACVFKYGTFYFTYEAKCAPSLQGPQCNEYKPSPMAAPLADIFSSRNGVLVKDMQSMINHKISSLLTVRN
uniref:C2 domain-containing protein n=1 Tax=Sinocyclocheilus anshuiensis TaxID=1608454 RepID=A0A671P1G1_9TELE